MRAPGTLVVGIGSPDAGDDAVGPQVVGAVAALGLGGVDVLAHEDPTDLTLLWCDRSLVVVVDAVRSGVPPGTVVVLELAGADPPGPGSGRAADPAPDPLPSGRSAGTHDFGLATAVGLSRALGTLPARLLVVGVEGGTFAPGEPMSPAVVAAVPTAVEAVLGLLANGVTA